MIKFLSSMKLAVTIIAAIAVGSIIATVSPQLNVYETLWFRALLLIFTINLSFCTATRVPGIVRRIFKTPQVFATSKQHGKGFPIDSDPGQEQALEQYFQQKRYQRHTFRQDGKTTYFARRGILSLLAPHLLHIAIIVVVLGAFLGTFGVESQLMAYVDDEVPLPSEFSSDLTVVVSDFETLYDSRGAVDNWVSTVELYRDGKMSANGTTMVNQPFKFEGISFYQSSYGSSHLIEITGADEGFYLIPDGMPFEVEKLFFKLTSMGDGALLTSTKSDVQSFSEFLNEGDTLELSQDTTLSYIEPRPFTVLALKTDPGVGLVMVGFALMVLSSTFFWTGRYREVLLTFDADQKMVYLDVHCKNKAIAEQLIEEISNELQGG